MISAITDMLKDRQILLVARSTGPVGGIVTYLADIVDGLLKTNAKVSIAINEEAVSGGRLEGFRDSVELYDFPATLSEEEYVARLSEIFDQSRPDLLHLNDNNRLTRTCFPRLKFSRTPVPAAIVTLHADIAKLGSDQWFPALSPGKLLGLARKRFLTRRFLTCFDRIISVSEHIGARLPAALMIPERKVISIPNGVDTSRFLPCERENNGHLAVSVVGGLARVKRYDIAIRSLTQIRSQVPVRLRIAGDDCGAQNELQSLTQQLGLKDKVEFLGTVADIPSLLGQTDIFLCTSTSETSCFAQAEAMSAGLPSVSSRYADLAIRVRHGIDGFLATPGDVSEFARLIDELISSPELRLAMGQRARERIIEKYSRETFLRNTLQVYSEVLDSSPACAS